MTTKEDIYQSLILGERVTLECKRATNSVPNSVWDTYSAFCNTYGGDIYLGVDEDLKEKDRARRFNIIGVEDAQKIKKDLLDTLHNPNKVSACVIDDNDIELVNVDDVSIVVVHIPFIDSERRPVYINNNILTGTYMRSGEGDYHCTKDEVSMMLRDASSQTNDGMLIRKYDMNDVDAETLRRYRQLFNTHNYEHVWSSLSDKDFLIKIGGYVVTRTEGEEGLTMAGLLMFGKGQSINEKFGNLRLDYIEYTDLIGEERYSYRLTDDGTWENNLFNFLRTVLSRISRDLPRPFRMEGVVRIDDTPQHKAVREALVNSISHGDLLLNGVLKVEKYEDKFVFSNPGMLMLPIEQIYAGGQSKPRNQRIQKMLRMLGYGENLGSGFPLILNAWSEKNWLKPELTENRAIPNVSLTLRIVKTQENVPVNEPQNEPVNEPLKFVPSERQKAILSLLESNPSTTRMEMKDALNVSISTIKRELDALSKTGIIKRHGSDKTGFWEIQ